MKEGNRIKFISIALILLSIQLIAQSPAQADSPRSWGYWNAGPAAGLTEENASSNQVNIVEADIIVPEEGRNTGDAANGQQNVTRLNRGLVNPAGDANKSSLRGDYVVYNVCYFNCAGNQLKSTPETAGKLLVDVDKGDLQKSSHTEDKIYSFTNGKPYVSKDTDTYTAELKAAGTYNGKQLVVSDFGSIEEQASSYYDGRSSSTARFKTGAKETQYFSPTLDTSSNGSNSYIYRTGYIYGETTGKYYIGKPVVASQIATQLRLGQTYHFSGNSFLGSNVNVAVNFQKANWNGSWGSNKIHNGFTAGGNIKSSNLTSNQLNGIGSVGNGFVTGGKVNATLVGVINGTDASKAAVIGHAIVDVQQVSGTKAIGDVFQASKVR